VEEISFNTKYCDEAEGEVTVPPISLRQQDLKPEYSVQTARTSYLYFNFGTHSSTPDEIMERIKEGAKLAFQKVIDALNIEYENIVKLTISPLKSFHGRQESYPMRSYTTRLEKKKAKN